jgi:hypothetical protein
LGIGYIKHLDNNSGGGDSLIDLINVPLKEGTIKNSSFIICLDLSRPHTWISLIDGMMDHVRKHAEKLVEADLELHKKLINFWKEHADRYICLCSK